MQSLHVVTRYRCVIKHCYVVQAKHSDMSKVGDENFMMIEIRRLNHTPQNTK